MKKPAAIVIAASCAMMSIFALTGCDALGLRITESGIEGNSNTLLLLLIAAFVIVAVLQRLLEK
jgi:hypothetical protein